MLRIFHVNCAGSEGSDVVLELDTTHEVGEPRPEAEAIEVPQQGGVMEADPTAAALFDVTLKCGHRCGGPIVGRIVELNEELVVRKEGIVDGLGVLDVVDREVIPNGLLRKPYLRGVHKGLMNTALFGERNNMEWGPLRLRL